MKDESKVKVGRRDFLRILGSGAGVAAAVGSFTAGASADTESYDEKRKPRYQETEHVKAYYRVNRYPG
ncbi:MAG TPA: formate dehydrogenase [Hyphomicrobiaceae bacterium]|nr:formate dehydrogenase [Hyphomicrobiaceae bacterium]